MFKFDVCGDVTTNGVADNAMVSVLTTESVWAPVVGDVLVCSSSPSVFIVEESGSSGVCHHAVNLSWLSVIMVVATNTETRSFDGFVCDTLLRGSGKALSECSSEEVVVTDGCICLSDENSEVGSPHCVDYPVPV